MKSGKQKQKTEKSKLCGVTLTGPVPVASIHKRSGKKTIVVAASPGGVEKNFC